MCKNCGAALQGGDEAALFLCAVCGTAYEPLDRELLGFRPLTASITTELAVGGDVRYLAFWRSAVVFAPTVLATESAWARLCKANAPRPVHMYIPAFTLARAVVQRLGVSLAEAQPVLELTPGFAEEVSRRPSLVEVGSAHDPEPAEDGLVGPDFGTLSPVVVGRADSRILANFVFLALESHETPGICSVDYRLETSGEELVFIPAVWDPRCVHDSNWRLLLREYDGLVA